MNEIDNNQVCLITIPQAAERGLLNVSALRTLVRDKTIPAVMIGSRAYINYDVAASILRRMSGADDENG